MARTRVAVVTGSNRGIGPEIVHALRKTGFTVLSNGRSSRKGPGDVHVRADVSTPAGADRLIAAARKQGGLDLLVCAVGDFFETPVSRMALDDWETIFDSNLRTAWLCCKAALPLLRKRRGAIVTFGGTVTQNVRSNPRYVAYQMSKTALTVFTRSLAQAEGPRGVRVNMINPGFIRTYNYAESEIPELTRKVPLKRLGDPKDIAEAVAWLASDAAAYVNGAVLDVGGGLWV
jgi:NAD(P)-dependent dehydrogenase (short-subunit alcohol dehydrogenase family)